MRYPKPFGAALFAAACLTSPIARAADAPAAGTVAALSDPDAAIRERAAAALGNAGPSAIEPLVGALADVDSFVAGAAAAALARIGEESVPALTQALGARPEAVRAGAAIALGKLGASARPSAPALVRALMRRQNSV